MFVHELGHFLFAKKAGVRVDEFGFGYPPRALVLVKNGGRYFTLNWIPFGGFVKIAGEDYEVIAMIPSLKEHSQPPQENSHPGKKISQKFPKNGRREYFSQE